ncbi:hypothetical protein [Arthrobacter sp. SO5]|nr:hypothetical protein [Arthrobacter sp. SO5]
MTTTAQPEAEQGTFSANLLIEGLHRQGHSLSSHLLETTLVQRCSTRRQR